MLLNVVLEFYEKVPREFWRILIVTQVLLSRDFEIRRAIVRIAKTNTILKRLLKRPPPFQILWICPCTLCFQWLLPLILIIASITFSSVRGMLWIIVALIKILLHNIYNIILNQIGDQESSFKFFSLILLIFQRVFPSASFPSWVYRGGCLLYFCC